MKQSVCVSQLPTRNPFSIDAIMSAEGPSRTTPVVSSTRQHHATLSARYCKPIAADSRTLDPSLSLMTAAAAPRTDALLCEEAEVMRRRLMIESNRYLGYDQQAHHYAAAAAAMSAMTSRQSAAAAAVAAVSHAPASASAAAAPVDPFSYSSYLVHAGAPALPSAFLFPPELSLYSLRKPKRVRTAFSPSQLLHLERAFEHNRYVVGQERRDLAASLSLSETQVKVWFQNRRTKTRRSVDESVAATAAAAAATDAGEEAEQHHPHHQQQRLQRLQSITAEQDDELSSDGSTCCTSPAQSTSCCGERHVIAAAAVTSRLHDDDVNSRSSSSSSRMRTEEQQMYCGVSNLTSLTPHHTVCPRLLS